MADTVEGLLDQYWDLAYAEGQEGRRTDTPDGDAQRVRSAISSALEAFVVERDEARRQLNGWRGFYAHLHTAMDEGRDDHQKVRRQARLLGDQAYRLKCLRAEVRKLLKSDPYTANQPFTYRGMIRQNSINFAKFKAAEAARLAAEAQRDKAIEALKLAEQFIVNGIDLGYVVIPPMPDTAVETLPAIRAALNDMGKPE